jgi:hydroxymethylglutaryl-CoA reductase (NADPH)
MHPIHTIVVIALLASTSYVGLLQQSLFDTGHTRHGRGYVDVDSLLEGGRTLELSSRTSWKWQSDNTFPPKHNGKVGEISIPLMKRV